jgi:uncharacterized SAM-binding protein YcdF (DUF218 family)
MTLHLFFAIFWRVALAAIFLVVVLAVAAFLFPRQVLTIDSGEVKADALIVLGGGEGRAERAAELYHHGDAPLIIVTGHGDCMANVSILEHAGVPASAIKTEPTALTTLQNAKYSVPLIRAAQAHRVVIVTSWYHSRRALACFEHVAPDLQLFSRPSYYDYEPKSRTRAGYNWHVDYEYVKIVGYWVSYGVCPL